MPRHYQSVSAQVRPTLATLPNFAADLTKPGAPAVKFRYAAPDFISQVRPTLAMLPRIVAGTAEPAPNAQPQRFWQVEIARQVQPTLAMLPKIVAGTAELAPDAQPQRYALPAFAAPDKFGIAVPATPTIAGWSSTLGPGAIVLRYAKSDTVAQVQPRLATLPSLTADLTRPGLPPAFLRYATTRTDAPDRVGIPVFLSYAPFAPELNARRFELRYAFPDIVAQLAPTLATLARLEWNFSAPAERAGKRFYHQPRAAAPDKAFPAEALTLDKWNPAMAAALYEAMLRLPDGYVAPIFSPTALGPFVVCGAARVFEALIAASLAAYAALVGTGTQFGALVTAAEQSYPQLLVKGGFRVICND